MKPKFRKPSKKIIVILSALVVLLAVGCGLWYYFGHTSSEPVYVYSFQYIGMTEYWGDSQESYGPVTTDKIQTIFLTDTQTVTEICVKEGDTVKKGDLLMTFDTTLSDLALEKKRLEVEKLKLQLDDAKKELKKINSMKPMEIPQFTPSEPDDVYDGFYLTKPYYLSSQKSYDGSSQDLALICWLRGDTSVSSSLFETMRGVAQNYQNANAELPDEPEETTAPTEDAGPTEEPTQPVESTQPSEPGTEPPTTPPTQPATEPPTQPSTEPPATEPSQPESGEDLENSSASETDAPQTPQLIEVWEYDVIMKVTQGDMSLGQPTTWQGLHVRKRDDGSFSFNFFDASMVPDHMLMEFGAGNDFVDMPDIDFGSGFTAAQIAQMRSEQEKKIKDLDFQIKMADADYKIMQTEVNDGHIYASIDGTVISLLPEEEAKNTQQPVIKVSGGGGFYVEGSVSELDKDLLVIGQEVEINDWRTGGSYTGTVHSVGDFPSSQDSWSGRGNPNASYYPFLVFVDESADLQAGNYVSIMYSAGTSENGIYLENPFIRTEQGRSYVMVQGENGKLEQRFVTVGKSLWGSYTEILSGLTAEDLIAFPYGKNVKPGASVQEGDMRDLYG